MKLPRTIVIGLLAGACALTPGLISAAAAHAGIGAAALADCNANDRLTRTYTAAELQNALATMPATMREYTDCQDVVQSALNAALGNGKSNGTDSSGSGSGGSFLPTPVIVVLVLLALAGVAFAAVAVRRRREGEG
jgi:hypothetical protein